MGNKTTRRKLPENFHLYSVPMSPGNLEDLVYQFERLLPLIKTTKSRVEFLKTFIIRLKKGHIIYKNDVCDIVSPIIKKEIKTLDDFIEYVDVKLQYQKEKLQTQLKDNTPKKYREKKYF